MKVESKPCLLSCSLLAVETQAVLTAVKPDEHLQCLHLLSQPVLVLLAAALVFTVGKPVVGLAPKETMGNPISGCCTNPALLAGAVLPQVSLRANLSLCCAWQAVVCTVTPGSEKFHG